MNNNVKELYFDDEEVGIDRKTSHPNFIKAFTDEFYYDCTDEEAPFGNDNGADTLYELEDYYKNGNNGEEITSFPKKIVSDIWDLNYIKYDSFDKKAIQELINKDRHSILATDQVNIAVALGEIKITGVIDPELKKTALDAIKRLKIIFDLLGYGESETQNKIEQDLKDFN
ncbi:MAG: hypothetical protein KBF12_08325 [Sebaldella sp.]|nr:hypothetical protein [Sebaldella sp.]